MAQRNRECLYACKRETSTEGTAQFSLVYSPLYSIYEVYKIQYAAHIHVRRE